MANRFRPTSHVPRYSRLLFDVIRSPVVIYLFLADLDGASDLRVQKPPLAGMADARRVNLPVAVHR